VRFELKEEQITSLKNGARPAKPKKKGKTGVIVHVVKQHGKHILTLDGKENVSHRQFFDIPKKEKRITVTWWAVVCRLKA